MIIPPTETPGAAAAGVPEYIDRVVTLNAEHQPLARAGLAWLGAQASARFSRDFLALDEAEHAAILQPLSDAVDRQQRDALQARGSAPKPRAHRSTSSPSPTGIRWRGPAASATVAARTDPTCRSGSSG